MKRVYIYEMPKYLVIYMFKFGPWIRIGNEMMAIQSMMMSYFLEEMIFKSKNQILPIYWRLQQFE